VSRRPPSRDACASLGRASESCRAKQSRGAAKASGELVAVRLDGGVAPANHRQAFKDFDFYAPPLASRMAEVSPPGPTPKMMICLDMGRFELNVYKSRLNRAQSAIHGDNLASDPALFGVEKPRDGTGDFGRLTDAAKCMEGGARFETDLVFRERP
jgi:hypothetical protein